MLQDLGERGTARGVSRRAMFVGKPENAAPVADAAASTGLASEANAADALARLETEPVDCVVAEADLPDAEATAFLAAVGELFPNVARVLVGESVADAPEDVAFVPRRPADDLPARLARRVERAVERSDLARDRDRVADRFETLIEASPDAMVTIDEDCDVVYANPAVERLFGHDPASLVGESVETVLCERVHDAVHESIRKLRENDGRVERDYVELPGRHRDGREIPLAISFRETVREGRHYFSCIARDVSERKRLEERLGAEKRKTRELHEVAVMLERCETAEEVCRLAVETAEQLLEFDLAAVDVVEDGELVPQAVSKGVPTDGYYTTTSLDADDKLAARAYRDGQTIRTADLRSEGVSPAASGYRSALTVPMQDRGVFQAVSKEVGAFGESDRELAELLVAHVTQALKRIQSEEALQAERDRFAALFENIPEAIVDYEMRDGRCVINSVNAAFEDVFGYDADEVVGEAVTDLIVPPDRWSEAERHLRLVESGERIDAEVRREAADGLRDFLLRNAEMSGERTAGYLIYTDITEQKEREERHRSMTEDVLDNTDVGIFVLDDEFDVAWVNRSVERYFGLDRGEILGRDKRSLIDEQIRDAVEDDDEFVEKVAATYDDNTYVEEFTCHVLPGDGRRERHLQHLSQPIESGLYEGGRVELYYDVTERVEREEMLDELHSATRDIISVESQREILETAVETTRDVLDIPHCSVFHWNDGTERLEPYIIPEDVTAEIGDPPTFESGEGIVGTVFETGDALDFDNAWDDPRALDDGSEPIRAFGAFPLGDWGVLTVASQTVGAFDDYEIDLVRILAANTEVALNRAAREEEVAEQRCELAELNRINEVIRDIDQLLVQASTREEIAQGVCDRLTDSDQYRFAWIDPRASPSAGVDPAAWAGVEEGYIEHAMESYDETPDGPPTVALRTGDVQIVSDLDTDPVFEPWREQALERGYRSQISIPLRYRDTVYGVLCVYADRAEAFGQREEAVLAELGETIGHAINAVESKRALLSDDVVEVEFDVYDGKGFFARVAREEGCSFSLEGVTITSDGSFVYFVTANGIDPDRVRDRADGADDVERARLVNEHDDGHLFEFVYTGPSPLPVLADHGGTVREAEFTEDGGRSLVELPRNADVRAVVEAIVDDIPGTEVVAQRERERPERTVQEFRTALEDDLTGRQRSALEAAFYAGFFEWPRESTGEEVSESLGVSAPTFHQHLRVGERKLLESFLDE